jgi:hypothetical protein
VEVSSDRDEDQGTEIEDKDKDEDGMRILNKKKIR